MAKKSAGADDNGQAQITCSKKLKARLRHAGVSTDRTKWEDLLGRMCGLYEVEYGVPAMGPAGPRRASKCPA